MPKSFIDTNVIAHWMLISATIKAISEKYDDKSQREKKLDSAWQKYKRLKQEYDFLEKIRNNSTDNHQFITSDLAITEILSAMLEQYSVKKMDAEGIPVRYWFALKNKYKLSDDDIEEISTEINNFIYNYKLKDETKHKIKEIATTYEMEDTTGLILKYNCNTHDAVLVATAIRAGCHYFVTADERLRKCLKNYGKIRAIAPQTYNWSE